MLSVIIPSYKDPYLQNTIDSILENAEGEVEVIPVLDGYWTTLKPDPRVKIVHLGQNRGMRGAINAGVAVSKGDVLMRTDEHCMFAKGFDKVIIDSLKDNQIVVPRRYALDPVKWEIMKEVEPVDCMKLKIVNIDGVEKFSGVACKGDDSKDIEETMAMQGSCWLMTRNTWDTVVGELQTEGYGPHYQDSHEMVFKLWQNGGKFYVNKNTWYAHKHRSFSRTHQEGTEENPANRSASWTYALEVWRDYYENEVLPKWT